jgi:hypothetical protein
MNSPNNFPLGVPVNRPQNDALRPIEGRPNWFRDKDGHEVYREPARPGDAAGKGVAS